MRFNVVIALILPWSFLHVLATGEEFPVSEDTQVCLECHMATHPGIVANWNKSRHAQMTPKKAQSLTGMSLKVSSKKIPQRLQDVVVGCAECHGLRSETHKDSFDHNDAQVHVVVTPSDCAVCHQQEAEQFQGNLMAHARGILANNPDYHQLERAISGIPKVAENGLSFQNVDEQTQATTCYYCHGTQLEVTGFETRETNFGEMDFPKIKGWPNQGVGRANPDGSLGSCSACHARHQFSMAMARQPHTCRECHVGPDVPAVKVYSASKHGNLYATHGNDWDFNAVPWTVGRDFGAPTCATCHISLLTNTEGEQLASRTHQMTDRLSWRIFGLIYAHPQPKHPDTSRIKNRDGQHLPTTYDQQLAKGFLIDAAEQQARTQRLQAVCLGCHDTSWVEGHFQLHRETITRTNAITQVATDLMKQAWKSNLADPSNPFDEFIERKWCDTWLMYANTIRFATAMGGGGDFTVYADGYYQLSQTIAEIHDWLTWRRSIRQSPSKEKAASPKTN